MEIQLQEFAAFSVTLGNIPLMSDLCPLDIVTNL